MQPSSQVSEDVIEKVALSLDACSQAIRHGDPELLQDHLNRLIVALQSLQTNSAHLKLDAQARANLIHLLGLFKQETGFQQLQLGRQLNILQKHLQVLIPSSSSNSVYSKQQVNR